MTRVGLTTTAHRAAPAAHSLREAGHEPVLLPCIEVRPTDPERIEQIRDLAHTSDVILITSTRAVRAVWDDEPMPQTPVLTVGDVSAAAVRESGGVVTFAGTGDLAEVLDSVQLENHTILYPCSSLTDHTLRHDQIEAVGAKPVIITAYHVTPIPPPADPVDVVVFASPSAVAGWLLSRPLEGLGTAAIGPTTEKRLLDAGVTPTAVSDRPDLIHSAHLAASGASRE